MERIRDRFADHMVLGGYSERTIEAYTSAVGNLVRYCSDKPPLRIREEEVGEYLLYLKEVKKVARGTFSIELSAAKLFFGGVMKREWDVFTIARPRYDKKLPVVLSRDEVRRILACVTIPGYRACLTVIYACGLRLTEGLSLTIPQVDGDREMLHIHGKGRRDRLVPLPKEALALLRDHWRTHRSPTYLFPAVTRRGIEHSIATDAGPIHRSTLQGAFCRARDKAGVRKKAHVHTLRHSYATHLLEAGVWRKKRWVANVKKVGSGDKALLYLSRYVFRVAISDDRIESFDGERVRFRWVDSKTGKTRRATLLVNDFISRFLQHVLPRGFVKVRYFGLWAPPRRHLLAAAAEILQHHLAAVGQSRPDRSETSEDERPSGRLCPHCGAAYSSPPRALPRARGPP